MIIGDLIYWPETLAKLPEASLKGSTDWKRLTWKG